jgi:hypothetical protein
MTEWNKDVDGLFNLLSNVAYRLLVCDKKECTKNGLVKPTVWRPDFRNNLFVELKCYICKNEWKVCLHCNIKKKIVTTKQTRMHRWKYHDKKKKEIEQSVISEKINDEIENSDYIHNRYSDTTKNNNDIINSVIRNTDNDINSNLTISTNDDTDKGNISDKKLTD